MKAIFRRIHPTDTDSAPPTTPPAYTPNSISASSSTVPSSSLPITVVELFQSQGCNSCPPANDNLISLASSSQVQTDYLLLTYHVTYWDYLGWTDTFGSSAFDARQRDYVRRMSLRSAFTPQVIVNGRASGVGSRKSDLERLLGDGSAGSQLPVSVSVVTGDGEDTIVTVNASGLSSDAEPLEVVVAWFDPERQDVQITRGENKGETLPHLNVVKSVERVGLIEEKEGEKVFVLDRRQDLGVRGAVLVQKGHGGWVVGAARI
ncbi:DUF1223-domain-containing protein [Rhizodiscina lignyota]|uniref:DUF1223-domain-containing protein n=1 Tax=Rhizodiscina lignyota TaxID=1504668 RepID=A0A9P4ILW0_9PEZI|nr:DUF1223-domain-containing protein [Rhizodiscina lignyota]